MARVPNLPLETMIKGVLGLGFTTGLGVLAYNSVYSVKPGQKAVEFSRLTGLKDHVYSEGTRICIPLIEWPIIFDIRTRPRPIKSTTGTKDLQMVDIGLKVFTRPNPSKLPLIYRTLGENYDDKVLPSIVNEVVKQVIAQYSATNLLTQRDQVSKNIKELLYKRAADFHIILEDVLFTDLKFGSEFERAVEAKQVAQQEAERAKYIVEKAKQDKMSIIIRAKGEAEAAELIGKAIANNPGFMQLRRIDAAKDIAHRIANSANTVYLPSDSLLLNLVSAVTPTEVPVTRK